MRMSFRGTVLILAAGVCPSLAPAPELAEVRPNEFVAEIVDAADPVGIQVGNTGDKAIAWLGNKLVREVSANPSSKDPAVVVAACHLRSLPSSGAPIPSMPSVTAVKITSLRLNNPANTPDAADRLALEFVAAAMERGQTPRNAIVQRITRTNGNVEWRVYRPLAALPNCLQCHGRDAERSPELSSEISRRFLKPEGIGYKSGEWRGLLRVSISPPPTPPGK